MKGTAGDSWMTGQQVKLMMDKDFPESPLSAEVVLDSPQGQNLDRQIQDHEHQNSNSQNPILDQTGCSNLDQNRSEVPRGEKDPGLASGQDADCPDPPGAQNQTLQLDLDHADVSGWDVDQDWDRERTRANQEADPESGGSVPSLVITRATEQAPAVTLAERKRPTDTSLREDGADVAAADLLSLRGDSVSLASEMNISRTSEDDDSASVTASSVTSVFHRVHLDPLEKAWMRSSALGNAAAQRQLLFQESSLVLKKDFITGTALHWAAKQGCQDVVDMLLCSGADVNVKSGYTALHLASIHGHQHVVHALIHIYNAKTNIRDYHGKIAAHYWSGSSNVFQKPDLQSGGRISRGKYGQCHVLPSLRLSRSRSQGQLNLDFESRSAGRYMWDLQV
ncbi:ankyrin repeat domain-containing protein SOWAHC isoform X3 [Takifugu rubripes]|uniref:ankyrin repeat domain-containing protein SOWAHC isoform X3 n=1 Tax=Takifugu rubripes TaxID=31033 RepID=UPI001145A2B7|nr:ankyrin repeat domain-containing protein SOWAHC-like isoform X3 [Takifugu rubripes]